jgi:hypothetical protein
MKNKILLGSFCAPENIDIMTNIIHKNYKPLGDKIYMFSIDKEDDVLLTYSIQNSEWTKFSKTIRLNRNSETNTLYSINAINEILKELDYSKGGKINFLDYKNSLVIISRGNLMIKKISLIEIITLK